jgi:hypothetical protein
LEHRHPIEAESEFFTYNIGTEDSQASADEKEPVVKAPVCDSTKSAKVKRRTRPLCRRLEPNMTPQHAQPVRQFLQASEEPTLDVTSDIAEESSEGFSQALMGKVNKEMERQIEHVGLWTYYTDMILQHLGEREILLLENGEERSGITGTTTGPLSDYFKEAKNRIQFAKWFRPLTFVILTTCLYELTIATFQADPVLAGWKPGRVVRIHDWLVKVWPALQTVQLAWSLTWLIVNAAVAFSIQLTLTAVAWIH